MIIHSSCLPKQLWRKRRSGPGVVGELPDLVVLTTFHPTVAIFRDPTQSDYSALDEAISWLPGVVCVAKLYLQKMGPNITTTVKA
jgi:hypothetical protein